MVALLPEASLRVPPFKAKALAAIAMPPVSVSPAAMVYVNTKAVLPLPEA